jgi:iron complex transport system substrate-binding protein
VTAEGLAELAPDVIIDLVPDLEEKKLSVEAVLAEWRAIEALDAVRGGRVYVLSGDYVEVPGPRFVRLLDDMARAIHPDVPWDEDPAR